MPNFFECTSGFVRFTQWLMIWKCFGVLVFNSFRLCRVAWHRMMQCLVNRIYKRRFLLHYWKNVTYLNATDSIRFKVKPRLGHLISIHTNQRTSKIPTCKKYMQIDEIKLSVLFAFRNDSNNVTHSPNTDNVLITIHITFFAVSQTWRALFIRRSRWSFRYALLFLVRTLKERRKKSDNNK